MIYSFINTNLQNDRVHIRNFFLAYRAASGHFRISEHSFAYELESPVHSFCQYKPIHPGVSEIPFMVMHNFGFLFLRQLRYLEKLHELNPQYKEYKLRPYRYR